MKRRTLLMAASSGVAAAALGCGGEQRALQDVVTLRTPAVSSDLATRVSSSVSASDGTAGELFGQRWVVGAYLPLTGGDAQLGIDTQRGIELAVDTINAAGGVRGRPLRVAFADDKSTLAEVPKVVRQLIERDRVLALIGEVASARTLPAAMIAASKRVPMITPSATNAAVTRAGEYTFRTCFIDEAQGTAAADFAVNVRKMRKLAIIHAENEPYSMLLAESFRKAVKGFGATIVAEQKVLDTSLDFAEALKALKAARPYMIYAPLFHAQMRVLGRAAKLGGLKGEMFLGADGWSGDQGLLDELEGAFFTDIWAEDFPTAISRRFVAAHRAKYNAAPTGLAAAGYDATMLLADAMKRARSLGGEDLRHAIATTQALPSVTGPITITGDRNSDKPITVVQIANKTTRYVDVVGPGADVVRAEAKAAP